VQPLAAGAATVAVQASKITAAVANNLAAAPVTKREMAAANLVRKMSALTVDSNAATTLGFPKDKEYKISVGEGLIVTAPTPESADAAKKKRQKQKQNYC